MKKPTLGIKNSKKCGYILCNILIPFSRKYCSNKCRGLADKGVKVMSEESKQKIGKVHKGTHLSMETKQKIGKSNKGKNKGIKRSEETKLKMSKNHKGGVKHHSNATKELMHLNHKGGVKYHSKESKLKMSNYHKANPVKYWEDREFTNIHKENISNSLKGRIFSIETRKKLSENNVGFKGRHHKESSIIKMKNTKKEGRKLGKIKCSSISKSEIA